jgi:hypothetical protein
MKLNCLEIPLIHFSTFYHPLQGLTKTLVQYRSAGLSNGRQTFQCPRTRMALLQLRHQDAVRQEDHVHVAGLTTATPKLTFTHAQMLLAIPMEAFRACPAMTIHAKNPSHFPTRTVRDQCLFGFLIMTFSPEDHNANLMIHTRNTNTDRKIPLTRISDLENFPIHRIDLSSQVLDLEFFALEEDFAIELQIANIIAFQDVDAIQIVLVSKPAIKGKVTWDIIVLDPINELSKQDVVITELNTLLLAVFPFNKAEKLQGIVLTRCTDVVNNQIVMGDFVTLISMIPKIACIFNQFAAVVHQDVVNGNDALGAELCFGIGLQPVNAMKIECFLVPVRLGYPPVQTGLIRGGGELPIDRRDVLLVRNHQAREIFGKMLPLGFIGEHRAKLLEGVLDDCRKINNSWHRNILHDIFTNLIFSNCRQNTPFVINISTLQKSSSTLETDDEVILV